MFKYLGACITASGGVEEDVCQTVKAGHKAMGGMKQLFKCRRFQMSVKKRLYEGVVMPTVMYGSKTWGLRETERERQCI